MSVRSEPVRPRLRGWIHAGAVPLAAVGAVLLWSSAQPLPDRRASVAVFGVFLLTLFGVSALYHVPDWRPRVRHLLSRVDLAVIQLFIAASFTPLAVHALDGHWRTWSLVVAWTVAVVGAAVAASPLKGPRWATAGAYLGFGWLGVVPAIRIADRLPWPGLALIALSGVAYSIGAIVYARQRPDPWPRWFGFHEIFHLLVVAGGTAHFVAIWRYALPL